MGLDVLRAYLLVDIYREALEVQQWQQHFQDQCQVPWVLACLQGSLSQDNAQGGSSCQPVSSGQEPVQQAGTADACSIQPELLQQAAHHLSAMQRALQHSLQNMLLNHAQQLVPEPQMPSTGAPAKAHTSGAVPPNDMEDAAEACAAGWHAGSALSAWTLQSAQQQGAPHAAVDRVALSHRLQASVAAVFSSLTDCHNASNQEKPLAHLQQQHHTADVQDRQDHAQWQRQKRLCVQVHATCIVSMSSHLLSAGQAGSNAVADAILDQCQANEAEKVQGEKRSWLPMQHLLMIKLLVLAPHCA